MSPEVSCPLSAYVTHTFFHPCLASTESRAKVFERLERDLGASPNLSLSDFTRLIKVKTAVVCSRLCASSWVHLHRMAACSPSPASSVGRLSRCPPLLTSCPILDLDSWQPSVCFSVTLVIPYQSLSPLVCRAHISLPALPTSFAESLASSHKHGRRSASGDPNSHEAKRKDVSSEDLSALALDGEDDEREDIIQQLLVTINRENALLQAAQLGVEDLKNVS